MTARVHTPASLAARINRLPLHHRFRTLERLRILLGVLDDTPPAGLKASIQRLERLLTPASPERLWLSLAVLNADLPLAEDVLEAVRVARLDGPLSALVRAVAPSALSRVMSRTPFRRVEVVVGGLIVDVEETSRSHFSTGIQRVSRQVAAHWRLSPDVTFVGWHPTRVGFRRLTMSELDRAIAGEGVDEDRSGAPRTETVLVPWKSTYVLPELTLHPASLNRLTALARFSGSHTSAIGFDCVPVTSAETVDFNVAGGFAGNLSALKFFDRVAAISDAAAVEYQGWRVMLSGSGIAGPEVRAIDLPAEAVAPLDDDVVRVRELFAVGDDRIILSVGSHEPRKNHLALLHAAELAWRQGAKFSLVFVGGNSWRSQGFDTILAEYTAAGRKVASFTALPDNLLWAAYRTAHAVAFPSLNEGFGLPIAEALALGTPVLTSNYGSMAQIAAEGGAVLVDPRDDHAIAAGLVQILDDDALYARLRSEAKAHSTRSWEEYSREAWEYLLQE
jgi:hypothetical protein